MDLPRARDLMDRVSFPLPISSSISSLLDICRIVGGGRDPVLEFLRFQGTETVAAADDVASVRVGLWV